MFPWFIEDVLVKVSVLPKVAPVCALRSHSVFLCGNDCTVRRLLGILMS